jgi:NAD(P)-dependent dehydrogenase (short-subunit alcohol dehydrogenase family)
MTTPSAGQPPPGQEQEGADVAIAYLSETEDEDAARTAELVSQAGRRCVTIRGDLGELITGRWERTFRVNVHSYFWTTRAALKHPPDGGVVINTSSINELRGNKTLIDYAATEGAVLALTYSLARALQDRGIRVKCVAPGPVWTPLIPATLDAGRVGAFGSQVPMGRAAHLDEIARSYVFSFACGRMSSYYPGEVLAPLGGETLPG